MQYHVLVTIGTHGSIVVCVTPLTAVMLDQKAKFTYRGLKAEFVREAQDNPGSIKAVVEGLAQLVYISPESLIENMVYRKMLLSAPYKRSLVALVVDEAHCVKTW